MSPYIVPGLQGKSPLFPVCMTIEGIAEAYCKANGISLEYLQRKTRRNPIIRHRQALTYYLKCLTIENDAPIAALFHQDRTTVINSMTAVKNGIETDEKHRAWIASVHPFRETVAPLESKT